jgi:hypothetical protein
MRSACTPKPIYENLRFSEGDNVDFIVSIYLRSESIKMPFLSHRVQLLSPDVSQ